jgi:hypothetical protein
MGESFSVLCDLCGVFAHFAVKAFNHKCAKVANKTAELRSARGLRLCAIPDGPEETFAFEMQNNLLRCFFGRQLRRVDDDLGVLRFFVGI